MLLVTIYRLHVIVAIFRCESLLGYVFNSGKLLYDVVILKLDVFCISKARVLCAQVCVIYLLVV